MILISILKTLLFGLLLISNGLFVIKTIVGILQLLTNQTKNFNVTFEFYLSVIVWMIYYYFNIL